MAEPELRFWHKQGHPDSFEGVPILYANQFALKVGFDKLATSRFLQDNELPYLKTEIASEAFESFALPCILKSRQGSGSKNLFVIRDEESLRFYATRNPTAILQQLVEGESEEYTCGVFRSPGCGTRSIIFRRKLQGGLTGSGEVVVSDSIRNLLESMAAKLDLRGSINVQLRMRGNTPLVFEINPRFSSTVMFRHKLGFKDLIWSIQDCFNEPVSDYAAPIGKITFFRGAEEVFYS
ncbi:MAG: ATP-grasp domain-containing protein [Proteobacteria bacterium]|nr:MAG: ATP-grasp domain-containing protein [Pseudomonadota bacterium]